MLKAPLPVCNIARAGRSNVLGEDFKTSPDKGYSAIIKTCFYGYKLHLIISAEVILNQWILQKHAFMK